MKHKTILGTVALILMGSAAVLLANSRLHQRLGEPGVKTRPIAGSNRLEVLLPPTLPGYTSEILTNSETVLQQLPPDTSYRVRYYTALDKSFGAQISVVLMGTDRASIHRPEICMTSQGWEVNGAASKMETIAMHRPGDYQLTVNKLVATKTITDAEGNRKTYSGIYVFWFVDASHLTANQLEWMFWWMPRDLISNGILERWAYISYFSLCPPGQEDAAFDQMKKFIALSVPEFQLVPRTGK